MTSERVGYIRVSTWDQDLALQRDALERAGCTRIFEDVASGAKWTGERPGLREALSYLRAGDTLVVWKLDRLGRELKDLVALINDFKAHGIGFVSLTEQMDTSTPQGMFLFHLAGAFAQMERSLIRERIVAGMAAARARGQVGGRRPKLSKQKQKLLLRMAADRTVTVGTICETFDISETTYHRIMRAHREEMDDLVAQVQRAASREQELVQELVGVG